MATIEFESVSYKNFLATGNHPNTIQLNRSTTTAVIGHNGCGKTTFLDAISFALFGKPYRNIRLGQLINSINGKQCEVTINFKIGEKSYQVIRGMKPNKLEIYENGTLLAQDASKDDYQKRLEQQILRLNYRSFIQLVVLGATSFTPFMQLKSAQRREIVEDILDINIFSTMNLLLKDRISASKTSIQALDHQVTLLKSRIKSQNEIIDTISKAKDDNIQRLQSKISDNESMVSDADTQITKLLNDIKRLEIQIIDLPTYRSTLREIETTISIQHNVADSHSRMIRFFDTTNQCPTCSQSIDHDHKHNHVERVTKEIEQCKETIQEETAKKVTIQNKIHELEAIQSDINKIKQQVAKLETIKNQLLKTNQQYLTEISDIKSKTGDITTEKKKLKDMAQLAVDKIAEKNAVMEDRQIQDICVQLLKDTGIKTAIIKEYLPIMNTMINHYLNVMDTFIKFELDEAFNETIKSRYRDEFTYDSFSEGEKKRIDIAILFAWRHIAKLKNSINTNLLIMDEIADSSLDDAGLDFLIQLINEVSKDANVFVISHRGDALHDKFRSILRVEKKNDFSVIT